MFQEYNRKGEAYQTWVYKAFKKDGRKNKVYKVKEGTVFNELGRIGRQVISTDVKSLRAEGWKTNDEIIGKEEAPNIEKMEELKQVEGVELKDGESPKYMIAEKLLKGEGLNFSSFIRAHNENHKDQKIKKAFRPAYDKVLKEYEGKIYKQGHDYFLKDK